MPSIPAQSPLFALEPTWPTLPDSFQFGKVSAVGADSRGRIYVAHRGEHPMVLFDPEGRFIRFMGDDEIQSRKARVFGEYLGQYPRLYFPEEPPPRDPTTGHIPPLLFTEETRHIHGLHVDPQDNVWVTDAGRSAVFAYNPDGRLTQTLGSPDQPGDSPSQFNQPTDVVRTPEGFTFVSDGYANNRILKFSPDGQFLKQWGREGKEPGEFRTPHTLTLDDKNRLYVSDRWNRRVQIFDLEGQYLDEWKDLGLSGSRLDVLDGWRFGPDGHFYGSTGHGNKVIRVDSRGNLVEIWGSEYASKNDIEKEIQKAPGAFNCLHGIALDSKGNLFCAEVAGKRLQKFRRSIP